MKVLFDHQIFFAQRYGGISRYIRELAVRLDRRHGVKVSVVAPLHINEYLRSGPGFSLGWPYYGYSHPYADQIRDRARRALLPRLYARHRDADIVHETYFSDAAFGSGRRRVTTMYDMIYEIFPEQFSNAGDVTRAKRRSVDRCDHIICISESTRNDLIRIFDVAPERTSVIHLGYDLVGSAAPLQRDVHVAAQRPYILFVGNRGLYKNFARLAEAYACSSSLRKEFDLVAFGGRKFASAEADLFARLGIANRVLQVEGNDSLLEVYYRHAAVFAFPSMYEGFGIPPLEAMSFGCPVACSSTSSIPEVVGDAAALFDPASVDSIRAALEQLLGSETLRAEFVARGYARVKAFSWDRCADETAAVYRRVIDAAQ